MEVASITEAAKRRGKYPVLATDTKAAVKHKYKILKVKSLENLNYTN